VGALGSAWSRSVDFIAWGNFVDPAVLGLWARSFALLAAVCVVAWAAGSHACHRLRLRAPADVLVVTLTTGLAVLGLVTTILALVHAYVWWAVVAAAVAIVLSAPRAVAAFPNVVAGVVRDAPVATLVALVWSLPALLPPYRWDEVSYHLAYPQQWVAVGHLTVDPHLAYPLYTLTWQTLLGVALMLGSPPLAHLLSWLTGVLTAWCIGAWLTRLHVATPVVRVARLAFLLTPAVMDILDVALVDVPIMCFLTVAIYALFALRDEGSVNAASAAQEHVTVGQTIPAAICGATCLSLKVTNVLFVPLFIGIAWYRLRRRPLAAYLTVLLAAGSVWYIRNLAFTGDPVTPLVAHALGRPAPFWSPADLAAQAADLRRGLSYVPTDLLALPLRVVTSTVDGPLRGPPLLGYALLFPASLLLVRRLARGRALDLLAAAWYATGTWVATTYLIRYAYWIPLAIVCAALVLDSLRAVVERRADAAAAARRGRSADGAVAADGETAEAIRVARWHRFAGRPVREWVIAAGLLIGPTLSAPRYAKALLHTRVPTDPAEQRSFAFGGCADTCAFGAVRRSAAAGARIYNAAIPMTFYWQQASFHVVDGAFHPGGLLELQVALNRDLLADFLRTSGADFLVVQDRYLAPIVAASPQSLTAQLRRALGAPMYADTAWAVYAVRRPGPS